MKFWIWIWMILHHPEDYHGIKYLCTMKISVYSWLGLVCSANIACLCKWSNVTCWDTGLEGWVREDPVMLHEMLLRWRPGHYYSSCQWVSECHSDAAQWEDEPLIISLRWPGLARKADEEIITHLARERHWGWVALQPSLLAMAISHSQRRRWVVYTWWMMMCLPEMWVISLILAHDHHWGCSLDHEDRNIH